MIANYVPPYGALVAVKAQSKRGRRIAAIDSWGASRVLGYKIVSNKSHILHNLGSGVFKCGDLSEHGVRIRIPERGEFTGDVYRFKKPFTAEQRDKIFRWWHDHNGEPYGYLHLARMWLWYRLSRIFRIDFKRVLLHGTGRVCSTAADQACKAAGLDLWPGISEDVVGPALLVRSELLELVQKNWTTPGPANRAPLATTAP